MKDTMVRQPEQLLLSAKELAETLSISERQVWRRDACGALPCGISIGKLKRWRYEEIRAWVDKGCPGREEWQRIKNTLTQN